MRSIPSILALFTIISLFACSTQAIRLNILEPAKESIPVTINSISLFPVAGLPDPPGIFDSIRKLELNPKYDYNKTKKGYIFGIYDVISSSPRFQQVKIVDSAFTATAESGIINRELIEQICAHDSTEALLLLNKVMAYDELGYYFMGDYYTGRIPVNTTNNFYSVENNSYYSDSRTRKDYIFFYRLISHITWALYQPDSLMQPVVFNSIDTVDFYSDGVYRISLNASKELLYNSCFLTGSKIGKRLAPTWNNEVERTIFVGLNPELREASRLVKNDDWLEAGRIWYMISEGTNRKLSSKASCNLAIAWEKDDDIGQAILWIQHADSLYANPKIKTYRKTLEGRLKDKELLDRQLNSF